jgi:hypothetical protein
MAHPTFFGLQRVTFQKPSPIIAAGEKSDKKQAKSDKKRKKREKKWEVSSVKFEVKDGETGLN